MNDINLEITQVIIYICYINPQNAGLHSVLFCSQILWREGPMPLVLSLLRPVNPTASLFEGLLANALI